LRHPHCPLPVGVGDDALDSRQAGSSSRASRSLQGPLEAAPELQKDIALQGLGIGERLIDRGYASGPLADEILGAGGEVICKPLGSRNGKAFTKAAFRLNMRDRTITCPADEVEQLRFGSVMEFDSEGCDPCRLRPQCTAATAGGGRSVTIAANEKLQHRLRRLQASPRGRTRLRERAAVEHRLAHLSQWQGRRARDRGVRESFFDLRRARPIQSLETIQRKAA
jgi:hypothetical protein